MPFKHISLFSGIGGFDLAAQWMGWENIAHCEINPFCQRILKYYWPNAKTYTDIKTTDFTIYRGQCDIVTGGFPCQPYSTAGKRKGKEDERHLWPHMLRAIQEISPQWVVGENVRGLTNWNGGVVFDEVQADLEAEGYEVLPFLLPAAGVNAPHRRDRIWFIAHANINGARGSGHGQTGQTQGDSEGQEEEWERLRTIVKRNDDEGTVAHAKRNGHNADKIAAKGRQPDGRWQARGESSSLGESRDVADAEYERLQIGHDQQNRWDAQPIIERQHSIPSWDNFPTQSPLCSGNDGVSTRLDGITFPKWRRQSIEGAGNAIVPQVAYQIFKAIKQYECSPSL